MAKQLVQGMTFPFCGQFSCTATESFRFTEDCEDLARLLGRTREELQEKELACVISAEVKDEAIARLTEQLACGDETEILLPFCGKNGSVIYVLVRGMRRTECDGTAYIHNLFVTAEKTGQMLSGLQKETSTFITKLSQTENRINLLQTCAEQDSLTKVFNAGTTKRLVEEYLSKPEVHCAMLIIDIDNFKHINDCYGHMTGDGAMVCAANAIKKQFRANDIVGRIGGDEFLVLMKDITDAGIVASKCAAIIAAFNTLCVGEMQEGHMCCSIGAAVSCTDKVVYNAMFLCADKAMYRTKQSGGNNYIVEMCECSDQ